MCQIIRYAQNNDKVVDRGIEEERKKGREEEGGKSSIDIHLES